LHCKVELQNELNSNKDIRYKKLEISVEEIGTSPFVTFHKVQTATDTSSRPPPLLRAETHSRQSGQILNKGPAEN